MRTTLLVIVLLSVSLVSAQPIISLDNPILIYVILGIVGLMALTSIAILVYAYIKLKETGQLAHLFTTKVPYSPLHHYIHASLHKGVSPHHVKTVLLHKGWPEHEIDKILKRAHHK